jgi:hypothetical protein
MSTRLSCLAFLQFGDFVRFMMYFIVFLDDRKYLNLEDPVGDILGPKFRISGASGRCPPTSLFTSIVVI